MDYAGYNLGLGDHNKPANACTKMVEKFKGFGDHLDQEHPVA